MADVLPTLSSGIALGQFILRHPLTRTRLLSAMFRVVSWQIRSRLTAGEIVMPWFGGAYLVVRRGMTGATGNLYAGLHEFPDMAFALHLLRPDDVFFDVGANIGSYTVLASAICGARSHAFEPDRNALLALRRNIEANRIADRVVLAEVAIGPEEGEIDFTYGLDTMNRIARPEDTKTHCVRMQTLDAAASTVAPILLKIDIEGSEERAIDGAAHLLCDRRLKAIQLETVTSGTRQALEDAGFREFFYDPFGRSLHVSPIAFRQSNALFLRDIEDVKRRLKGAQSRRIVGVDL